MKEITKQVSQFQHDNKISHKIYIDHPNHNYHQNITSIPSSYSNTILVHQHHSRSIMSSPSPATASPLCSGISHIGLTVSNLQASLLFFEALGYTKVGGDEAYPSYFISNGTSFLTLWKTTVDDNVVVPFNRKTNVGLHHLAIQVASEESLHAAYNAVLKVAGTVDEFGPAEFGFGKHAMVYDPSGLRIELALHL